jgi:hypothetical protein
MYTTTHPTRAARLTGLAYLGLAVTGGLGFLVLRPRLFADGDPAATLANLAGQPTLARTAAVLELLVVLTQTLAAAGFFGLFRTVDPVSAAGIAAFGLVNATALLASAALLGAAAQIAAHPVGDAAATVQLLYLVSDSLWGAGAIFFGLWLIPMGRAVLRSGWMPRLLGWILVVGGAGYVLNALAVALAPDAGTVVEALTFPATVGELWMIGYLLFRGVRPEQAGRPGTEQVAG